MDPMTLVDELAAEVDALAFAPPVACVYNPLRYARAPLARYFKRMWRPRPRALLLGMNPGPFGMVQTGIPFGEVELARTWLGVAAPVDRPAIEQRSARSSSSTARAAR